MLEPAGRTGRRTCKEGEEPGARLVVVVGEDWVGAVVVDGVGREEQRHRRARVRVDRQGLGGRCRSQGRNEGGSPLSALHGSERKGGNRAERASKALYMRRAW